MQCLYEGIVGLVFELQEGFSVGVAAEFALAEPEEVVQVVVVVAVVVGTVVSTVVIGAIGGVISVVVVSSRITIGGGIAGRWLGSLSFFVALVFHHFVVWLLQSVRKSVNEVMNECHSHSRGCRIGWLRGYTVTNKESNLYHLLVCVIITTTTATTSTHTVTTVSLVRKVQSAETTYPDVSVVRLWVWRRAAVAC